MEKMKIKWLAKAKEDFENELKRIAEEAGRPVAVKLYRLIEKYEETLVKFPNSGRPGQIAETRELVITGFPYIMPYRVKNGVVEILRFFHTSQNPPNRW